VATATESTDLVPLNKEQVLQALEGQLAADQIAVTVQDPQEVALSIIKRILASESPDEVFQGQKALGGREVLGRPFQLKAVRWHKSSFEGVVPVFAVLDSTMLDSGEDVAITTGSSNVMAQAYKLDDLGALPVDCTFQEADKETAAGFRPQWLNRIPTTQKG